jgi:CMP-N-acetylneuraminic acid synthetase
MENLILIPARGGSTRVKNKNLRSLGEKPLIGHVISAAVKSNSGRVIVSTDSEEIAEVAKAFGAEIPFFRPKEFSTATASSIWAIHHALRWLEKNTHWIPQMVAFCPPTNPFIASKTISEMFQLLSTRPEMDSIVTIVEAGTHPFRIIDRQSDGTIQIGKIGIEGKTIRDIERTQDWPKVWEGSPACRLTRTSFFQASSQDDIMTLSGKTYNVDSALGFEIDKIQAYDIDDEFDWMIAEVLQKSRPKGW